MKNTSIWKRYQFCGGASVFGTECYIDELTDVVHCTCKKEDNLKGFDWTIIFYFFQMVYSEKIFYFFQMVYEETSRRQ